jgi:hypothetical protein
LETLQTRLINNSIRICSRRFVKELKGFIWNSQTKKAEAAKGFHDDAIIALCLALYARDSSGRYTPVGAIQEEEYSESFKMEIYESIKKELSKDAPDNWDIMEDYDDLSTQDPQLPISYGDLKRKQEDLLREFGW